MEPLNAVVCSRVHALQEALSAATIALEISGRNARVADLQKRWDRLRAGLELLLDQRGADMADLPGGASVLLVRDYKGKEADRVVTRIDPGVVSLVAELRSHERQSAEELEQWRASVEERKVIDARPPAIKPAARHAEPAHVFPRHPSAAPDGRAADGWRDLWEWEPRRGKRALQKGDRASADALRWNLDLILDQWAAEMADVPGGASGLLVRDDRGKEADQLITRIAPGVVSLVGLRGHERQAVEKLKRWKTHHEERRVALANEREPGP